ncbi:MAG: T9SS type A sorting domain-containing protein [Flavobacteriales bacterium]|nr:T9SS type A sorting domain-containing protein [Flavobacteriales bacterium]
MIVNFLLNHSIADPGVVCGESNVAENGELAILSVFPIPARDQLQFNIAPQPGSRMQVSDARGRMLWQGAANGVRTLQLPNLSAGHYLLRVTPPQGRPFTLPFTVGE